MQKPLPIWVGGEALPSLRRAVTLGDGWYPVGSNAKHPLDTMGRFKARVGKLYQLSEDMGRDPATITLAYHSHAHGPQRELLADTGERRMFCGEPAQIADDLRELKEMGLVMVDFRFTKRTIEASEDGLM